MKIENILALSTLIVVKGTSYGISFYSPLLIAGIFKSSLIYQCKPQIKFSELLFICVGFSISFLMFQYHGANADFFRFNVFILYMLISFSVMKLFKMDHKIFTYVLLFLSLEAFMRIASSGILLPNNIYDWKANFIFYNDSNFPGFIIGYFFVLYISCVREKTLKKKSPLFVFWNISLLLLSISRTAWVAVFGALVLYRVKPALILVGFIFPLILPFLSFLYDVDGSLNTKLNIVMAFNILMLSDLDVFLFGLGREFAGAAAEAAGSSFVGHTFHGNALQSGIIPNLFIIWTMFKFDKTRYKVPALYFFIASITGLMPVTLAGPCLALSYGLTTRNAEKLSKSNQI